MVERRDGVATMTNPPAGDVFLERLATSWGKPDMPWNHRFMHIQIGLMGLLLPCLPVSWAYADEAADRLRRRTPVVDAYEQVRDSVVNITAVGTIEVQQWGMNLFGEVFPFPSTRNERSVGSGFILHPDGYIATNAHVISTAAQLGVTLADGTEYEAKVIGRDTKLDLAVIKVDAKKPLKPMRLGHSADLMIGEQTIAVGNPVGLHNTVTVGVLSALHRELEIRGRLVYRDLIQTDASINPGNSGGPLLNVLGELIGINTAIRGDAQNIGFAIPVDQLREILPPMLDCEKLNKVVSGFQVGGADPPTVRDVRSGGPADRAGVQVGDVIAAVNGEAPRNTVDFLVAMLERNAGEEITLRLTRGGQVVETRCTLDAVPKPDGKRLARERLGLSIEDAREDVARRFLLRRPGGVIILGVEPRSPADRAGLRPGDLLVAIGSFSLSDVDMMGRLLAQVVSSDPVELRFRRERRTDLIESEVLLYAR